MDSQLVTFLTAIITTTITCLISGIFGILQTQIQTRSVKLPSLEQSKILLPPGVELTKPISKPKIFLPKFALFVVSGAIVGILLGVVFQRSQPVGNLQSRSVFVNLAYIMLAFLVIGTIVFGIVLSGYQKLNSRKWSISIAVSITLVLVLTASYFMLSNFLEERTVYFLVDESANAQNVSREILTRLNLNVDQIPDNVEVGLAVFGGSIGGETGCDDITEMVKPTPKQESVPQIKQAVIELLNITPSGDAILQNSIIYALSRLSGRQGIQQIIIMTDSLNSKCGILNRKFLNTLAYQSNTKYEITIIYIGQISKSDSKNLAAYADHFVDISTAGELPSVIQEILFTPPSLYKIYNRVYP